MVDLLQMEELDVSGALLAMQETKNSLNRIRRTENAIANKVQTACLFASQFNVDAEAEFQRIHRKRVPRRCLGRFPFEQKIQFAVPECGKMERYSVTDLVNNGSLVGSFPFHGNSGKLA